MGVKADAPIFHCDNKCGFLTDNEVEGVLDPAI